MRQDISFDKADAMATAIAEKASASKESKQGQYEKLITQYAATTVSCSTPKFDALPRALDILRHEYLNCFYDMKLWKIRTNDEYPARRLADMEKFLKEFDRSINEQT